MKIEENLAEKTISISSKDPYYTSLEFMRRISGRGKIIERENSFFTDGPFHRSDLVFDFLHNLDNYTTMKISFFLTGENNTRNSLRTDMVASFVSSIDESGFFSEIFSEFYLENVFPVMRKAAEEKIKQIVALSESIMKSFDS